MTPEQEKLAAAQKAADDAEAKRAQDEQAAAPKRADEQKKKDAEAAAAKKAIEDQAAAKQREADKKAIDDAAKAAMHAKFSDKPFDFHGSAGGAFSIYGVGLGTGGVITIAGETAVPTSWMDGRIKGPVPPNVKPGKATVVVNGKSLDVEL